MKFIDKHKTAFIFSGCAVIVILILIYFGTHSSGPTAAEDAVLTTVSPVRTFFKNIGRGFYDITHCIGEISELRNQKSELQRENSELSARARDTEELRDENDRLRRMLELRRDNKDYDLVASTVIADEPSNFFASFTIDKGRNSGISEGQPAILEDGTLVGKVTRVGTNWAEIMTVVDPGFSAGAKVERSNDMGVAEGDTALREERKLKLAYLGRETEIEVDDEIVTTGLGGVFPEGLKIGRVAEIKDDNVNMSRFAVIEPEADLKDIREVFIITNNLDVVADNENANMKSAREEAEAEQKDIDKKEEERKKAEEEKENSEDSDSDNSDEYTEDSSDDTSDRNSDEESDRETDESSDEDSDSSSADEE